MSAFIVKNETVDRAITLWCSWWDQPVIGDAIDDCDALDRLGREMLLLNERAVAIRYKGEISADRLAEIDKYRFPLKRVSRVVAIKSLQCLAYQCCEGDAAETALYVRMERKINDIARAIVEDLPEWQAAEWG